MLIRIEIEENLQPIFQLATIEPRFDVYYQIKQEFDKIGMKDSDILELIHDMLYEDDNQTFTFEYNGNIYSVEVSVEFTVQN